MVAGTARTEQPMTEATQQPLEEHTPPPSAPAQANPWADLQPEHFQLLRLAPLPTDRDTGARPLRFVEFARVERHASEQSVLRLSIRLPDVRLPSNLNLLEVWVDHQTKTLRFGPEGGLVAEPENRGLGRFLLAQAIGWAQQSWGHYLIEGETLSSRSMSSEARHRRDHCLQTQGFEVTYPEPLQPKALYAAPRVSALRPDWNAEKVRIIEVVESAAMLEQADRNLLEQETRISEMQERMNKLRRDDGTLRFNIACLVSFALFQAGLLIWIATR